MVDFPPKPPPPPRYATRIDGRKPLFKHHRNLGQAKNAVGYEMQYNRARGGQIFEWFPEGWVIQYDVKPGTPREDLPWRDRTRQP
jgi:hypothetical protein